MTGLPAPWDELCLYHLLVLRSVQLSSENDDHWVNAFKFQEQLVMLVLEAFWVHRSVRCQLLMCHSAPTGHPGSCESLFSRSNGLPRWTLKVLHVVCRDLYELSKDVSTSARVK
jgi:hypothetical protein